MFSGYTSEFETVFFPPLHLPAKYEWEICLLDLIVFNAIPNVWEGVNNELEFYNVSQKKTITVALPTGTYEVDNIRDYIQDQLGGPDVVSLRANNNTLKTTIKSIHEVVIDYNKPTIAPLLGFKKQNEDVRKLEANIWHESNESVDIVNSNTIQVTCNIAHGSYKDGLNDHILHSFSPSVPPGWRIIEKPRNLIYLPVNVNCIDTIHIRIVDKQDNLIDFRGEEITVRLHVKKRDL